MPLSIFLVLVAMALESETMTRAIPESGTDEPMPASV